MTTVTVPTSWGESRVRAVIEDDELAMKLWNWTEHQLQQLQGQSIDAALLINQTTNNLSIYQNTQPPNGPQALINV